MISSSYRKKEKKRLKSFALRTQSCSEKADPFEIKMILFTSVSSHEVKTDHLFFSPLIKKALARTGTMLAHWYYLSPIHLVLLEFTCGKFGSPCQRLPVLGIFNVHTYVEASGCTWGLYAHRSLHWKSTSGEKIPWSTWESVLRLFFSVRRSTTWAIPHRWRPSAAAAGTGTAKGICIHEKHLC